MLKESLCMLCELCACITRILNASTYIQLLCYAPDRMTRHIPPPCSCHSDRGYDDIVDDNDWRTQLQLLGLRQLGTYNCRIRYFIPRRAMRYRNLRKSSHHLSRSCFVNIQCVCVFHLKCIIQSEQ